MFERRLNMFGIILVLLSTAITCAQSVGFTQYPTQVLVDQFYSVTWEAGGASVSINLLRSGTLQQTLYSGTANNFTWAIEDDEDGAIDYALQLIPDGNVVLAVTSGPIWLIEDEDGLLVNGQVIYASIQNGPLSSGLFVAPTSTTPSVSQTSSFIMTTGSSTQGQAPAVTSAVLTAVQTEVILFTSAITIFTFTATMSAISAGIAGAVETLTFVSNGLTFTTTMAARPTESLVTDTGGDEGGGISGGTIAGIVVGILVVLIFVLFLLWFRQRRRRQRTGTTENGPESPITAFVRGGRTGFANRKMAVRNQPTGLGEIDEKAAQRQSLVSPLSTEPCPANELNSSTKTVASSELAGTQRHEMSATVPRYELAAEEVGYDRGSKVKYPATCTSVSRAGTASSTAQTVVGSSFGVSSYTR